MGGSGGSSRYRSTSEDMTRRIGEAREKERERLNVSVNEYLGELLTRFNARDADLANKRLDQLAKVLDDVQEIETLLLGGSVAKHTDVDGISDVDALVILDRKELQGKTADEVKRAFFAELDERLPRSDVADVREGRMAIKVTYQDGTEIELLPALRSGGRVLLGGSTGKEWYEINPKRFQTALTSANQKLGRALVPAIKLLKSINQDLPEQKRLSGYHLEALAVDAAQSYRGTALPREVLLHICKHASDRVLKPITDITGQGRRVDEYMGGTGSVRRRIASQALAAVARRLETATSVGDWKAIFGGEE